jgi:hypothetical protein
MIAVLNVVHTRGSTLMDNIMINLDKVFSSLYTFSYCYIRTNCPRHINILCNRIMCYLSTIYFIV